MLAASLLGQCFREDSLITRQGYGPYMQCAREVSAACAPIDCLNLYYDVVDHCIAAADSCQFPIGNAPSAMCQNSLQLFITHSSTCDGLSGQSRTLGNGHVNVSFSEFSADIEALCLGCDIGALKAACPDTSSCASSCAAIAIPFYQNFETSGCQGRWALLGKQDDSTYVQDVYSICAVPCSGVLNPLYGTYGVCPIDGTLSYGTCALECNRGYEKRGDDPSCVGGILNPGSVTCQCPQGRWNNGNTCTSCLICDDGSEVLAECGYNNRGVYTDLTNTQCQRCASGTYKNQITGSCTPCTACERGSMVQSCLENRDTLCSAECTLPDLGTDLDAGTCRPTMSEGETCELSCRSGIMSGSLNGQPQSAAWVQPRCSGGHVFVTRTTLFLDADRWSADDIVCSGCADDDASIANTGRLSMMGITNCADAIRVFRTNYRMECDSSLGPMGVSFPNGDRLQDVCLLGCGVCTAATQVDCLGEWGSWSTCSVLCGGGSQTRLYTTSQPAENGGGECEANDRSIEQEDCNMERCVVDCIGAWGDWGDCTLPCGSGFQFRSYTVSQSAENGGQTCGVSSGGTDQQRCNLPAAESSAALPPVMILFKIGKRSFVSRLKCWPWPGATPKRVQCPWLAWARGEIGTGAASRVPGAFRLANIL